MSIQNTSNINTESIESVVPMQEQVKQPVQNIWKQRSNEASKQVKPVEESPSKQAEESPSKQAEETHTKLESTEPNGGKGYSRGKGYSSGKGYGGKGYGGKGENSGKGKGYTGGKGKGYTGGKGRDYSELSPEDKLIREQKTKAFNLAQDMAIKKCVDRCNPKVRNDINGSISYETNYRRTLVMDITEDDIVIDIEDTKHVYSFKRFLENRYFQNNLRDEYSKILPEAWIRLFPGKDERTFCIGIQRRT
jgi:hypothetical protein